MLIKRRHWFMQNDPFHIEPPSSSLIGYADDGGGGGGGGGGGSGGGDGGGDAGLTDEHKKFIANAVNSAVASFMKRDSFKTSINEAVSGAVGDAVKTALAEFKPEGGSAAGTAAAGAAAGDQRQGGGAADPRDQELAKLRSEQEKMRKQMEANTAAAEAEKQKAREEYERGTLSAALRKHGVDEKRVPAAVAYMYLDAKMVKRDDKDAVCMQFSREWGDELVPVEKGVEEYLKGEAGKIFLPPVEAGGSGNTGGKPPVRRPGQKPSRGDLMTQLGTMIMTGGKLPGHGG